MKNLYTILFLFFCFTTSYAQFKLGLSVQYDEPRQNYHQLLVPTSSFFIPQEEYHDGYTITANTIWTLTDYLSVHTGLSYTQKEFDIMLPLPFFGLIVQSRGVIIDPLLSEHHFSNVEIPLGFRFNMPQYKKFEIGLSTTLVTSFTMVEVEKFESGLGELVFSDPLPAILEAEFRDNDWRYYGNRLDLGIDLTYQIGEKWELLTAFYFALYDFRNRNFMDSNTGEVEVEFSPKKVIKSGQKSFRIGVLRSF